MERDGQGVTWDLTSYFPEFNGPEMHEFKSELRGEIAELQKRAGGAGDLTEETAGEWEEILLAAESVGARLQHIGAYIGCLTSADSGNEEYLKERAGIARLHAEFAKVHVDILNAFKNASNEAFEALLHREGMSGAGHYLRRRRDEAKYTMGPSEEKLATDLSVDGFHSWARLYSTISGKLEFDMAYPDGRKERIPISQWRALMSDPDREIGEAAFKGGNSAWETVEDVCAAVLNAIAGTRLTLYEHRGVEHYLDRALFQASIRKETLDAMYTAIHANIEIPREIFRAKARSMGHAGIRWFEREAPLALEDQSSYTWNEATGIVEQAFGTVYPGLAEYLRSVLDNRWLESEARPGKRPGAFCSGSLLTKEQRVFMTFTGSFGALGTIAHEVGHAFHSHIMRELRPMSREVPMTLAETASIFGESILQEGVGADPGIPDEQKVLMLDGELTSAAVLLLDITVRFEFEKALHEERRSGELSVSRLKQIMVDAQRKVFGDCLVEGSEDPLFWASKQHFHMTGISFYNFPYTFGFLIAQALYALFKKEGPAFLPRYEEFLRMSGSDAVENLVKEHIGADVSSASFWGESIRSIEAPLAHYKDLLGKRAGS